MRGFGSTQATKRAGNGRNAWAGKGAMSALGFACALTGCASGRPEIAPPAPRRSPATATTLATERAEPAPLRSMSAIRGDIRFLGDGDAGVSLGPIVIYLVRQGGPADAVDDGTRPVVATSRTQEFDPGLVAVARGRSLVLANEGPLAHTLFSAELGAARFRLPPGTRTAPFAVPARGPIRFYCTLHSEESFVVFGSPTEYVTVIDQGEAFEFDAVAAGRYTLAIWSRFVEGPVRDVFSNGFSSSIERVWIDPALIDRDRRPETRP